MFCISKLSGAGALTAMLVALLLCGLSGTVTGCNDEAESDMMQQMMAGGGNRNTTDRTSTPPATDLALAGSAEAGGTEDQPAEGDAAEVEQPIDNIIIDSVEVEAPYPEFDGEGRYDVKVYCMLKEYEEAQVYRIAALDAEGNEVGTQEKHLKLPLKKPRSFNFNEFYCTHMPDTVAFYRTDKEAVASEGEDGETTGSAQRGAAGSGSGDSGGKAQGNVGRGVAGGGG